MSSFGALLSRPHAKALTAACLVGWLTFSSLGLAVVLLVQHGSGSFAAAGAAVGGFSLGAGALAPLRGRRVDRHGRGALLQFAAAHTALLLALAAGGVRGWPPVALAALATGAGMVAPPLIGTARALWPRVAGAELTRTGHAVNALLGDVGTVVGPALAGGLAALLGPDVALAAMALGPIASALVLAALAAAMRVAPEEPAVEAAGPEPRVVRGNPGMHTVLACGVLVGSFLGAVQVVAPAVAGEDRAELGAAALVAFALGSTAGSLWSGRDDVRGTPAARYVGGFALLAVVVATAAAVRSVPALSLVLVGAGVGFGVLNVALLQLLDALVPERNAVEAFTWLTTAEALGLALGSAAAGALAASSTASALVFLAATGPVGALVALRRRATLAPRAPALAES